ncbi:MAG: DNA polymerase III subunit delta' [Rubellimicrobium sp.]|nr:DNA polymerase III subunit delta' [Rubellimicrobium sp.]
MNARRTGAPAAQDPEPDRIEGAPHPRETPQLYGQDHAEAEFLAAFNAGRLHSGWLLAGPQGVGKATLAWRIAAFLLASPQAGARTLDVPPDDPDLRFIRAGAHPRLFVLRRARNDKGDGFRARITVDETRRLRDFFQLSATDGGRRVVIVDAADEMNPNAANALLKLLEEPPPLATLLLVAHRPAALLPTIRSRCRMLRLHPLVPDDLTRALAPILGDAASPALAELAAGSVGRAVVLALAGGEAVYAELARLLATLPRLDRAGAARLAESCTGKANEARLAQMLDMADLILARAARAGVAGPPAHDAAPGEAALLARLAPDDRAARVWADLQQDVQARLRFGRAVNLDPAGLILDMLLRIERTAATLAAS